MFDTIVQVQARIHNIFKIIGGGMTLQNMIL